MKLRATCILFLVCAANVAWAQLRLVPEAQPALLFGGRPQSIPVRWRNVDGQLDEIRITARVLQASSATTVRVGDFPWKKLHALPGQTISESAQFDFPVVRAETGFLIQWIEDSHVLGDTRVLVYPTNLLDEMKPLLKGGDLGVLDPNTELKPVLAQNGVAFLDFEEQTLEEFSGKLAIIGPFRSRSQMHEGLAQAIRKMGQRGVAVVWIQPPAEPTDPIAPSFYIVPAGKASVVVVQSDLVADFSENPKSQLNLVYFCRLALNPAPLSLPYLFPQP
jgi:hypothetical protein